EGQVLGVDLESWPLVIGFVIVSAILAFAVVRYRSRAVLATTALVVGVAAVFDVAEIIHQANESRSTLVAIAAGVLILHLIALGLVVAMGADERAPAAPAHLVESEAR